VRLPVPRRIETIATILLSVAALCTSWAGYQATVWSGTQSQRSTEASRLRTKSSQASTQSGQLVLIDVGLFTSWLSEKVHADPALARFIEARFRPEFKAAFETWMATDPLRSPSAPPSPFSLAVYHLDTADSASVYEQAADSVAALGRTANRTSDNYVLGAVILATVMFFASTAQLVTRTSLRWVLLGLATLSCFAGVARLLTLPRA
jgi:hypothetical protein